LKRDRNTKINAKVTKEKHKIVVSTFREKIEKQKRKCKKCCFEYFSLVTKIQNAWQYFTVK